MPIALPLLSLLMSNMPMNNDQPIRLEAVKRDNGVELLVTGRSATPVKASYSLEVRSETSGNRSVQSGEASLSSDRPVSLVHLTLGEAGGGKWTATLDVRPAAGAAYQQVLTASTGGNE